eukprot:gene16159-17782_t
MPSGTEMNNAAAPCKHLTCLDLFGCEKSIDDAMDKLLKAANSGNCSYQFKVIAENVTKLFNGRSDGEQNCKYIDNGSTTEKTEFIAKMQERIKEISKFMDDCAGMIIKFAENKVNQKGIILFYSAVIKAVKNIFNHCKDSSNIYEKNFIEISADLSTLYKSTYQTLKIILEHLERTESSEVNGEDEASLLASCVMELLDVIDTLKDVDLVPLVNTLRSLNRIMSTNKTVLFDRLDVEKLFSTICTCVKEKLKFCWSLIKEASMSEKLNGRCTKVTKILRFLVGMLLQLIKEYSKDIFGEATQSIIEVLITLQRMTPISLNSNLRGFPLYEEFCSSVLSVLEPILLELLEQRDFISSMRSLQDKISRMVDNEKPDNISILLFLQKITTALAQSPGEFCRSWLEETDTRDKQLSLLDLIFIYFEKCMNDVSLTDVSIPSSVGPGKPFRDVTLHEYTCIRLCAFTSTVPSSFFSKVEHCLVKFFFTSGPCSLLAEDVLIFIARWAPEHLCCDMAHFFAHVTCAIAKVSTGCHSFVKSSEILRRLFPLMSDEKRESFVETFHPSKSQYIPIWLSIDINLFDIKARERFFKSFIPSTLKSLENSKAKGETKLMMLILKAWGNCLKVEDGLNFVSPFHRTAVIDVLLEVFHAFQKGECEDIDEEFFCLILSSICGVVHALEETQIGEILKVIISLMENNTSQLFQLCCCQLLSAVKSIEFSAAHQESCLSHISQSFVCLLQSNSFCVRLNAMQSLKEFAEVTSHANVVCDCLPESMNDVFSNFLSQMTLLKELNSEDLDSLYLFVSIFKLQQVKLSDAFENAEKNLPNLEARQALAATPKEPRSPIDDTNIQPAAKRLKTSDIEMTENVQSKTDEVDLLIGQIRTYLEGNDIPHATAMKLKKLANDINTLLKYPIGSPQ